MLHQLFGFLKIVRLSTQSAYGEKKGASPSLTPTTPPASDLVCKLSADALADTFSTRPVGDELYSGPNLPATLTRYRLILIDAGILLWLIVQVYPVSVTIIWARLTVRAILQFENRVDFPLSSAIELEVVEVFRVEH